LLRGATRKPGKAPLGDRTVRRVVALTGAGLWIGEGSALSEELIELSRYQGGLWRSQMTRADKIKVIGKTGAEKYLEVAW
jgi:hypothetical protein